MMAAPLETRRARIEARDAALYALGIGMGRDPMDARDLRYVCGEDGAVFPTASTVLADGSMEVLEQLAVPVADVLHRAEYLTVHAPLRIGADLLLDSRLAGMGDAPSGRGSLIDVETIVRDAASGSLLATLRRSMYLRGRVGLGTATVEPSVPLPELGERAAAQTLPGQALLFRLNGDLNPLHSDPQAAREQGFERPILHGLCTYGMVAEALLRARGIAPDALREFTMRFTAPVYPGEALDIAFGEDERGLHFTVHVADRQVKVADRGLLVVRP